MKYFRVPRFTMPSVKMSIPVKISELAAETKYNFKMNDDSFLSEVNEKIERVNTEKQLNIQPLNRKTLLTGEFVSAVEKLESHDYKFVKKLDDSLNKVNYDELVNGLVKKFEFSVSNDLEQRSIEQQEMTYILKETLRNRYTTVGANLNDIFIDPDTSKEDDKGKVLLTLDVEMVEEGLRIREVKDKDGNIIEEIIFE